MSDGHLSYGRLSKGRLLRGRCLGGHLSGERGEGRWQMFGHLQNKSIRWITTWGRVTVSGSFSLTLGDLVENCTLSRKRDPKINTKVNPETLIGLLTLRLTIMQPQP